MKKNIITLMIILIVININAINLKKYENSWGDIKINIPNNWNIKEEKFNNPYYIFISDIKLKNNDDKFLNGITITKYYHQSWQFELGKTIDNQIKKIKEKVIKLILTDKDHKIISNEIVEINNIKYLKILYTYKNKSSDLTLFNYYTVHNDSYLSIILECETNKLSKYDKYYDNFIKKGSFFSTEENDNHIVDSNSFKIAKDVMSLDIDNKDVMQYIELLSLAKKMNPFFPYLYWSEGLFYAKLCQNLTGKKQKEIAERTIKELQTAIEYFDKYGKDITDEKNLINPLSQSYFQISQIYLHVKKDKKKQNII